MVAAGFEEAAASRGFAVFMMTGLHDADREERALRTFLEHRADGVVLASCVSEPSDVFRYVSQERVVFVQPDYPSLADGAEPPDHGVLRSDDVGGFSAAIEHVVEQGYRRIAYVGPGIGASDAVRRAAAAETLERLGLGTMRFVDSGPNGWRDPSVAAEQLASDPPDAVVCYDDKLAMALLDALRSTQLDVPGEIGFMGFDGIPAARQSRPRLTTVDVPSVEIGRRAVEMLVDSTREGKPRPSEVLPVRLIVGETTPRVRRKSDAGGHATDAAALAAPGEAGR